MILITPDIRKRFPQAFRLARKDRFRVVWLEDDLIYVARRGKGHDRYLVRFDVSRDEKVSIGCKSVSGRSCEGQVFKGLCAHSAAVILRGIPEGRKSKQQSKAA